MSYLGSLQTLCDDLAMLHESAGRLAAAERGAAIVARDAILAAIADPYRDIAAVSTTVVRTPTLESVAQHPVATLRVMLVREPTYFPDERPAGPQTVAARAWAHAGTNASLLQHAWAHSSPDSWPTGAARWTALADLASVVEAVALLDRDLVPDPNHHLALPAGLRIAAREVRLIATADELPPLSEPPVVVTRPVRVTALPAISAAQMRLVSLLRSAEHIDPVALRNVTNAHRSTVMVLGWALNRLAEDDPSLRSLARAVENHGHTLTLGRDRDVASIWPGDARPYAQAAEIERVALKFYQRGRVTPVEQSAVLAASRTSMRVTAMLASVAEKQVATGKWLVPDARSVALRWAVAGSDVEPPRVVRTLRLARDDARTFERGRTLSTPTSRPSRSRPASEQLARALSSSVHRPQDPATRPVTGWGI